MHKFANPVRFNRLANTLLPWTLALTVTLFAAGLYYALYASPPDYQQGDSVRIMYVHVPASSLSLAIYVFMAAASAAFIIWKHPLAVLAAKAAAPIGMVYCGLALATGSIWGKPMWGTWWQWDARLTSMLVLFFLYLGYLALWQVMEDSNKAAKISSILALVGVVNIPIIKFSVEWWNTLHQPSSLIREGGSAIDPSMMTPLLLMLAAYGLYFVTVLLWRMKAEMAEKRLELALREKASWS
ncbi:MAG: heme ABC transporter permease [Proteobacteria bacterium]|nr:heme ABC transporter permease [Pseudomonadota bacterium]